MYTKILVPLDGSELAEQVLPHVIELAKCTGAEIVLLRVPDVPTYDYLMTAPELGRAIREQAVLDTTEYLNRMSSELREMDLHVTTHAANDGAVYLTILDIAEDVGADLIAMSTHGRGGLARMVMGSIADDVVRHATLPVLLVRPQPAQSKAPSNSRVTHRVPSPN